MHIKPARSCRVNLEETNFVSLQFPISATLENERTQGTRSIMCLKSTYDEIGDSIYNKSYLSKLKVWEGEVGES